MATVQVWVVPLDVPAPELASLVVALSPAERRRAERYHHPDHGRRFAAGRGWLRHVLGAELGVPPAGVQVVDGPGKPRLADAGGPCFNLSRAGDLALLAVSTVEVGVDVERHDGSRGLEAAPLACSPAELVALDRLPASARGEAFLELWTAKEAYLKASGVGLALAPDRVELGPATEGGALPVLTVGRPAPARWWVRRLTPRRGYVAAVAAEGRDWDIALPVSTMSPRQWPTLPLSVT
jgi:4'-phosphopantetheinyl transferase